MQRSMSKMYNFVKRGHKHNHKIPSRRSGTVLGEWIRSPQTGGEDELSHPFAAALYKQSSVIPATLNILLLVLLFPPIEFSKHRDGYTYPTLCKSSLHQPLVLRISSAAYPQISLLLPPQIPQTLHPITQTVCSTKKKSSRRGHVHRGRNWRDGHKAWHDELLRD